MFIVGHRILIREMLMPIMSEKVNNSQPLMKVVPL